MTTIKTYQLPDYEGCRCEVRTLDEPLDEGSVIYKYHVLWFQGKRVLFEDYFEEIPDEQTCERYMDDIFK